MKISHKTYLVAGLVCTGLIWAAMTAFGQSASEPPAPQSLPTSELDEVVADPAAGADELPPSTEPVAPGPGVPSPDPGGVATALDQPAEPAPARANQQLEDAYGGWSDASVTVAGDVLLKYLVKYLGAPDITLRDLQQADQQLEARIQRLVELYMRAIRGEETKFTDPPLELLYSQALRGEENEGVADPAKIREAIVGLVIKQFQIRQAMRKMEISSLEERVQRLKDLLQKREEAQKKIVESRLSQLLNAAEGLGWDSASQSSTTSNPFFNSFQPAQLRGILVPAAPAPATTAPDSTPPTQEPRRNR